jgi:hypothetical protein
MTSKKGAEYQQAVAHLTTAVTWLKKIAVQAKMDADKPDANDDLKAQAKWLHGREDVESHRLEELKSTIDLPLQLDKPTPVELTKEDLRFFRQNPKFKDKYVSRYKVYAVRLEGGHKYKFQIIPKGPVDAYLLLQTGFYSTVFEADKNGAGKSEEFTQYIRNTETYRIIVASSPNPFPDPPDSAETGSFTLTISVVKGNN